MKILHVWDQAGVACVLAKYQRMQGHDVTVIKTEENDPFGFLKFYGDKYVRTMNYFENEYHLFDVVHLHSYRFLTKRIKEASPYTKIILEYHGTDARGTPQEVREQDESYCDLLLYSTPDLIEWVPNGIWLPLPIDTEHFKETEHKSKNHGLFMKSNAYNKPISGLPFACSFRDTVPYSQIPKIFEDYDIYVDIQDHKENNRPIEAHSKTGLEALATGMSLYTYDRKFTKGLPSWHKPEAVVKRLDYLYNLV